MTKMLTKKNMLEIPSIELSEDKLLVSRPLVSVLMMTRNHESYIRQAVDSVLMQHCNFEFELLIGEDFSSDTTLDICKTLQKENPTVIRLIHADENVGITPNFLRLVARARGQYVALLEGDDYWLVPNKLQEQVLMLEQHPQYSWCGAKTVNRTLPVAAKPAFDLVDTLKRYIVHTSTVMFRAECLHNYPKFPDMVGWISMVYAYLAEQGKCGFWDETVSYYRVHQGGLWTGSDIYRRIRLTQSFTEEMDDYFDGRYHRDLIDRELWIYRMETMLRLKPQFYARWARSMKLVAKNFSRIAFTYPMGYCKWLLATIFQPTAYGYFLLRRKLAIGTNYAALKQFIEKSSRGK